MNLQRLLVINAAATLAAGIVLFVWPDLIPRAVGIHVSVPAYFLAYLLAASELAVAVLCFLGARLNDPAALRPIVITCIVFHVASGVAGAYAIMQGGSALIWWDVALRLVMVALFIHYGRFRPTQTDSRRC